MVPTVVSYEYVPGIGICFCRTFAPSLGLRVEQLLSGVTSTWFTDVSRSSSSVGRRDVSLTVRKSVEAIELFPEGNDRPSCLFVTSLASRAELRFVHYDVTYSSDVHPPGNDFVHLQGNIFVRLPVNVFVHPNVNLIALKASSTRLCPPPMVGRLR